MMRNTDKDKHQAMLTWIIPVYNGAQYIEHAIASILRQPCKDFEILVIDDGSTDNTLAIAAGIDCDCLRVIHKENGGVSSARNCGIRAAASKYIAFLDADDVICKNAYTNEIFKILEDGQYDLLSFCYFNGDQNLQYGNHICVADGEIQCSKLQLDPFKHCSSFIYHRKLFEGDHAIQFPEGIKIREDVSFQFLAYQRAERILNISRNWFAYRNNIASVMHQNDDYGYILHHAIPAWKWCKEQCTTLESAQHCDARLFSEAAAYIRSSCLAGVPLEDVRKVLEIPAVEEAISNYGVLWSSSKEEYESFIENPSKYWRKHQLIGFGIRTAKFFVRLPLIRRYYLRIKYKENIETIV